MPAIHVREPTLIVRVGAEARERIRMRGLPASDVSVLPGAAGGPKGVGIVGLDRAIFGDFLARSRRPRTLIGASIGSWRFAAVAAAGWDSQRIAANLERLADLYTCQRFPRDVDAAGVSRSCMTMLTDLLGNSGQTIIDNPDYRLVVAMDRSRGLLASDRPWLLGLGLTALVAGNLLSRRLLRLFMQRALACPGEAPLPLAPFKDFVTHQIRLDADNLYAALMASASIPLVLKGVRDIPGAPAGIYRDGGLLDYHLDLPYDTDGTVLYPHFTDRVIPGWFDKPLRWRRANAHHLRRVVLVSPSPAYLASLPHGKLPDRSDFQRYRGDNAGRERYWRQTIAESERLGDEFLELMEKDKLIERMVDL